MNSYELSRKWFDWCFDNPDRIKPHHTALYFFCIEHCNRLGWQPKFGLPTEMAKSAIGIHSYNTYISTLNDLIEFGFIEMVSKSKNQYSSNVVALSYFDEATTNALDKAMIKHSTKQGESTIQSTSSINKQVNIEPINKETVYRSFAHLSISVDDADKLIEKFGKDKVNNILDDIENSVNNKKYKSLYLTANKWLRSNDEKQRSVTLALVR